ncbi:MAG: TIGR01777 family oxidoreductase [Bacteroidia bacterium]|nr:TIGR01777 family oxidoreductase [Bacteroidia bacterium]
MKKLVIAGGTGFLGDALINYFGNKFDEYVILSRSPKQDKGNLKHVVWDAKTLGDWSKHLEGAECIINLCGKSVDCRYTEKNKALIFSSRLDSTAILGTAIANCKFPPKVWMNASAATIYGYSEDKVMAESNKETGTGFSIEVIKAWEKVFVESTTPNTRKINLRISMVMGKNGGVFPVLRHLTKCFLGGTMGSGKQYVSWIHETDFCRFVDWLIENKNATGPYNFAAPTPIRNREMMKVYRKSLGVPFGLPAADWMLEIAAFFMRTETELILKSRNVISDRANKEGFEFKFKTMQICIEDLIG